MTTCEFDAAFGSGRLGGMASQYRVQPAQVIWPSLASLLCSPPALPRRARLTARPGTCTTVSLACSSFASSRLAIPRRMSILATAAARPGRVLDRVAGLADLTPSLWVPKTLSPNATWAYS